MHEITTARGVNHKFYLEETKLGRYSLEGKFSGHRGNIAFVSESISRRKSAKKKAQNFDNLCGEMLFLHSAGKEKKIKYEAK